MLGSHDYVARWAVSQECYAVSAHGMLCKVMLFQNLGYISLLLAAQVLLYNLLIVTATIGQLPAAPYRCCTQLL